MKKVKVGTGLGDLPTVRMGVCDGKADASNEYYVSIQSENKSGLYLTAQADGTVVLAQDTDAAGGDGAGADIPLDGGIVRQEGRFL